MNSYVIQSCLRTARENPEIDLEALQEILANGMHADILSASLDKRMELEETKTNLEREYINRLREEPKKVPPIQINIYGINLYIGALLLLIGVLIGYFI